MRRSREQEARGVELFDGIMTSLAPWAAKLGVSPPKDVS